MADSQQGWREFNIYDNPASKHATDGNQENEEEEEEEDVAYASGMNLFGNMQDEEEEEIMNFSFQVSEPVSPNVGDDDGESKTMKTVEVTLKGFSDYTQSTGMALWLGSEILATFMAQHPYLIRGKTVMEMGSGLGLSGIVSHHLDSKKSVLTDGDSLVLNDYLSFNVKQNDRRQRSSDAKLDDANPATIGSSIECHQLIWGHQGYSAEESPDGNDPSPLIQFRNNHGSFDVVIAADCTYMPQSVEPFWETIDFMLKRHATTTTETASANTSPAKCPSTPKVLYVMEAATQAKFEDILDSAKRRGFEWTIDTMPSLEETPQYEGKEHEIYTFWRTS